MESITMYEIMPLTVIPKQNIFSCKRDPKYSAAFFFFFSQKKECFLFVACFLSWFNKGIGGSSTVLYGQY